MDHSGHCTKTRIVSRKAENRSKTSKKEWAQTHVHAGGTEKWSDLGNIEKNRTELNERFNTKQEKRTQNSKISSLYN